MLPTATLLLAAAAALPAPAPLTDCACSAESSELFFLPSNATSAPAAAIRSAADPSQCWSYQKTLGSLTCDGVCIFLSDCDNASTALTWRWDNRASWLRVASPPALAGWCLDENLGQRYLQAYPNCMAGDTHQLWAQDGASPGRVHEQWSGRGSCLAPQGAATCQAPPPPLPPPPPPSPSEFCPRYHPIRASGLYDPSGPLLDESGWWHCWEDAGGWAHYVSRDLLHWDVGGPATGFGGLTGSVAVTPSGVYAFYPEGSQQGIDMAPSTDLANLTSWGASRRVIAAPAMAGKNFRDPLRAFQWAGDGRWYVGVGCNNNSQSADLCLFRASSDALAEFEYVGALFTAHETLGQMVSGGVWRNVSVKATMMECPDVFALGNKWMLIGSLYSTNQYWIGTLAGSPPVFTPESVGPGIMDYGYGYAAKTGSTLASAPSDRRVVFGFTGWSEPTAATGCGRALIIPRDITLGPDGATPRISPIPELATLQLPGTLVAVPALSPAPAPLAGGSQVMISVQCAFGGGGAAPPPLPPPRAGAVLLRVLGTANGAEYTEVGVDFSGAVGGWGRVLPTLYVNHSACCGAGSRDAMLQVAPITNPALLGGALNLTVLVDGGLIEVFVNGLVTLTALVNPSNATGPSGRSSSAATTPALPPAAAACSAASWGMASIPPPGPLPPQPAQ